MYPRNKGFSLIELLVVIAIIGLLVSVILASLSDAREQAKVARLITTIRHVQIAAEAFYADTGFTPPMCAPEPGYVCSAANDPFLNSLGVPGWSGPYYKGLWEVEHGWDGHVGLITRDMTGDGQQDLLMVIDDDRPGTSHSDNQGQVPTHILERLDGIFDDGTLTTGRFRGNGITWNGYVVPYGEGMFLLRDAECPFTTLPPNHNCMP